MLTAKYIRFLIYIYINKQQGLFSKQLEGFVDLSALHKNVVKMLSLNMGEVTFCLPSFTDIMTVPVWSQFCCGAF